MKVLIIDDDKFIRSLFESELSQENIVVFTASDGSSGLGMIKDEKPDIVILDLLLPVLDGFAVLEAVQKFPAAVRGNMKLYVFSSLGQEHDRDEAIQLGASEYFAKDHSTVRKVIDVIHSNQLKDSTH